MQDFQQIIEQAWENRSGIQPGKAPAKVGEAVQFVLSQLDQGKLRVAEKIEGVKLIFTFITIKYYE